MTEVQVLEIFRLGVEAVISCAMPPLLLGLAVGIIVSIFQTVTSIHEQTLVFIPKILAVLLSLLIFGAFMIGEMGDLFRALYERIPEYMDVG